MKKGYLKNGRYRGFAVRATEVYRESLGWIQLIAYLRERETEMPFIPHYQDKMLFGIDGRGMALFSDTIEDFGEEAEEIPLLTFMQTFLDGEQVDDPLEGTRYHALFNHMLEKHSLVMSEDEMEKVLEICREMPELFPPGTLAAELANAGHALGRFISSIGRIKILPR